MKRITYVRCLQSYGLTMTFLFGAALGLVANARNETETARSQRNATETRLMRFVIDQARAAAGIDEADEASPMPVFDFNQLVAAQAVTKE